MHSKPVDMPPRAQQEYIAAGTDTNLVTMSSTAQAIPAARGY